MTAPKELEAQAPRLPRFGLAVLCAIHSAVFALVAVNVGWRWSWGIAAPCLLLAALHLVTFGLSVMRSRHLAPLWRGAAWCSLGLLGVFTWKLLRTALFVSALYEGLGQGIAAALAAVWGLVVLLTLPFSCWAFGVVGALGRCGKLLPTLRKKGVVAAGLVVCCLMFISLHLTWSAAKGNPVSSVIDPNAPAWLALSAGAVPVVSQGGPFRRDPIECAAPLDFTLPAAFVLPLGKPGECIQQANATAFAQAVEMRVAEALKSGPVSVDVLLRQGALHAGDLFDSLKLRPGLDGVCNARTCLLPWQLLITGTFSKHQPLPFLRDFRFGVSPSALSKRLGNADGTGALVRIATQHTLFKPGSPPVPLTRLRPPLQPVTEATLTSAAQAAEQHILEAQLPNGTFRYTLDPNTGASETDEYSLARQAGTTLALCESNTTSPGDAIRAALRALLRDRRSSGDLSFLKGPTDRRVRLASNTLPLAAFVACRQQAGDEFDPFIAASARFLLKMQRPDGGFFTYFDTSKRRPQVGAEPLFAPGQAILALTLLHDIPSTQPIKGLPAHKVLESAIQRAMDYVAKQHWNHPLYDVFFIEENWHCIAARAAQHTLADPAYEQLCFDYIAFRSQTILDAAQGAAAEFDGGMGVGHVIPPHNTGTAGLAEALAAAISVKKTRQLDTTADEAVLRRALGYLLRQQWSDANTAFAATPSISGAISEHPHHVLTRIDFVQHAWSAFSHGKAALSQAVSGS